MIWPQYSNANIGRCRPFAAVIYVALAVTSPDRVAYGQEAQSAQVLDADETVEEIVVTGTRIVRDGYEAPTPVTVIGTEMLERQATGNLADLVNTMPAFVGSMSPASTGQSISPGVSGLNALNLRSLGVNRTLVLLDGQRVVGVNLTGAVDINIIPQGLVSRVDVVTGGASAAYGSDALAGVVNFVLDRDFTGIKGDVSGGVTTYGDDENYKVTLTGGTPFADGRGHFLLSGEVAHTQGVMQADRDEATEGWTFITNPDYTPTNGQPQRLLLPRVGPVFPEGGIIAAGPLRGIAFGLGGQPYQFDYGEIQSGNDMVGGQWKDTLVRADRGKSLNPRQTRESAFTRISYDVLDDINIFAQASWARSDTLSQAFPQLDLGRETIQIDNPFIPASVVEQMQARGLATLTIGSTNADIPLVHGDNTRRLDRYVVGANGPISAFGSEWFWDAYFQRGVARETLRALNTVEVAKKVEAQDAVMGPDGAIICRSTLTNPNNGCIPYNLFGIGVNNQAAIDYITRNNGFPFRFQEFTQNVYALSVTGDPISLWAGPVSLAFGIEHRAESVTGRNDPISSNFGWWTGNYQFTSGSLDVTEGFAETVIPLAEDEPWAQSLDLNAAVRATNYSSSGNVTTWKVGAIYSPGYDDVTFRITQSRDIRAANLHELFAAGGGSQGNVVNPFTGLPDETLVSTEGNPRARPERSNTTSVGVVLRPSFVPGLTASIDYWNLDIEDVIDTISGQQIVDLCFTGNQDICNAITFGAGDDIEFIRNSPFNLVSATSRGIDLDVTYNVPLSATNSNWGDNLTFRLIASHFLESFKDNGLDPPTDTVGSNAAGAGALGSGGPPDWRWMGHVVYDNDPVTISLTGRGISSGVYANNYIVCTSGCPTSTFVNPTVNANDIAGAFYLDAGFTYRFLGRDQGAGANAEFYLNIRNVLDKGTAIVAPGPSGFSVSLDSTNPQLFDTLGRVFRVGVRFNMM